MASRHVLSKRLVTLVGTAVICAASVSVARAQFGRGGFFGYGARIATPQDFDGRFHYCRIVSRRWTDRVAAGGPIFLAQTSTSRSDSPS